MATKIQLPVKHPIAARLIRHCAPRNFAFSLLELLITVAIILILTTLYFGPNTASRQQALKRSCQKNLEKIYVSL